MLQRLEDSIISYSFDDVFSTVFGFKCENDFCWERVKYIVKPLRTCHVQTDLHENIVMLDYIY